MPTQARLEPLKSGNLRSQVVSALKHAILSGRFNPGDPIREVHVGAELGVSQNTVREALLQLEQLGLVVRNTNRNTVVTKLSHRDIEELVSVRLLLEPKAFCLAANTISSADIDALRTEIRELAHAASTGAAFDACQSDLRFHRQVWQHSGHRALAAALERTILPLFAFVSLVRNRRAENLDIVPAQHQDLVRALESRNPRLIAERVRSHIVNAYGEFIRPDSELL
jgi:DNA-binding GntR family transcriptional regulator